MFIIHKHHLIFDLSILAQAISKMRPASCQSGFCLEEITLESGGVWTVVETRCSQISSSWSVGLDGSGALVIMPEVPWWAKIIEFLKKF